MTARTFFTALAVASFVGLAVVGLLEHDWRTAVAGACLAVVNGILFA